MNQKLDLYHVCVGNWINVYAGDDIFYAKVVDIDTSKDRIFIGGQDWVSATSCGPVEITPGILEKIEGYEYNTESGDRGPGNTHKIGIGRVTFLFTEVERIGGEVELEMEVQFNAGMPYESMARVAWDDLHELQNLYYLLSAGFELKINL